MGEREIFLTNLSEEYQDFKEKLLEKDKETIYGHAYKIEAYACIFNIIVDYVDENPQMDYGKLLCSGNGLIGYLYREWLGREDDAYRELSSFVIGKMKAYRMASKEKGIRLKAA